MRRRSVVQLPSQRAVSQECAEYHVLTDALLAMDWDAQHLRLAVNTPPQIMAARPAQRRSSVSNASTSQRKIMRRLSLRSKPTDFSGSAHPESTSPSSGPTLQLMVTPVSWWRKTVQRRALAQEHSDSLLCLVDWLRSKPCDDLVQSERLGLALEKYPTRSALDQKLLAEALDAIQRHSLELRAKAVVRKFALAYTAVTDNTLPVSWDVLCEEHEAAVLAKAASQVRERAASKNGLPDDAVSHVVEGVVCLVDLEKKEDQLKRVADGVDWFSRAVKALGANLVGVSCSVFAGHIRAGTEINMQAELEATGGLRALNRQLEAHALDPLPSYSSLAREVRRRRIFLAKCHEALATLMVDCIAVLGNVHRPNQAPRALPFNLSGMASRGAALLPDRGGIVRYSPLTPSSSFTIPSPEPDGAAGAPVRLVDRDSKGRRNGHGGVVEEEEEVLVDLEWELGFVKVAGDHDNDDEGQLDEVDVDFRHYPGWWAEFNNSPSRRRDHHDNYVHSVQQINAVRNAQNASLKPGQRLSMLPVLGFDDWEAATRRNVERQALAKAKNEVVVARKRAAQLERGQAREGERGSNGARGKGNGEGEGEGEGEKGLSDHHVDSGGSLDDLRPAALGFSKRAVELMHIPPSLAHDGNGDDEGEQVVAIVHFLASYLDHERQGYLPQLEPNGAGSGALLLMTRREFSLLFNRCIRLRDVCTAAVEVCAQTVSKLVTLERVLRK